MGDFPLLLAPPRPLPLPDLTPSLETHISQLLMKSRRRMGSPFPQTKPQTKPSAEEGRPHCSCPPINRKQQRKPVTLVPACEHRSRQAALPSFYVKGRERKGRKPCHPTCPQRFLVNTQAPQFLLRSCALSLIVASLSRRG